MGQGSLCAEDACILCDPCLLDGYMGSTVPGSNTCDVPGPFCGSIENNQWWAFLAPPSGTVTFNFSVSNCTGTQNGSGIQAEVYSTNTCDDFVSVSNCWSPGASTNGSVTATNLTPYCTYYLMVDGWAGDFCDFQINTSDCMVPPNPNPFNIVGPTEVCPGAIVTYTLQPPPAEACGNNSNSITWTGIEPFGTIIGPNDQPTITVQWNQVGATVINALSTNVCFGVTTSIPLPVVIEPIPPTVHEHDVCLGECVTCAGQLICTPGLTVITLQSWLGCDSVINCIVNPIAPVFEDLGEITICAPETFTACGEIFDECGVGSAICDNWQGCDSTVAFDLAILDPMAVISPPDVLGCGSGASVILDGGSSNVAQNCIPNAMTSYSWSGPAGGISGPSNTPLLTVTLPGEYCLTLTHSRSGVSCEDVACVTVIQDDDVPQTPQLSGPLDPCPNVMTTYTVTPVGTPAPTGYTWDTGGVPFTDNGTSIDVTWPSSGPQQVCVTADNDCGSSDPACVTVNVQNAPTATISGGGSVCPNSTDEVELTITLTGAGPWTVGYSLNGGTATNIMVDASPHILTVTAPGTYTLTTLSNDAGCDGIVNGSAVVDEFPVPTASISGTGSICAGSTDETCLDIVLTGTAPWTVNWAVDGVQQASFVANANPHSLCVGEAQAGTITLVDLVDGNGCDGTVDGSGTVTVNTAPMVSDISTMCDPTNTTYTVTFTVSGGDQASWSVTPQNNNLDPTTGIFTSDPIPSGDTYSFTITDDNNCDPITLSNTVLCDCDTDAGSMDGALIEECGDGPVTATHDGMQVLDGNDVLVFVLHSGNGVNIAPPVIGTFDTPTVGFQAPMTYGTTYYLSSVAGDDDGMGGVDLNDPCLDVSQGTPVVFYEIPTATLSGDPVICEGETAQMTVDFTGTGPWSLTYDDGTGQQTINGITANPYTLEVTPSANASVALVSMSDVNCPGTVDGASDIVVNTAVAAVAVPTCDLSGTFYTVTITISGGDMASYFVDPPTGTFISANEWLSDPINDGEGFIFVVDDANGCDPQTVQQTEVLCDCTTEVGDMDVTPIEECSDGPVTALYDPTSEVLDPDDVQGYILHTNSGGSPGTVIATNDTDPTFGFQAGMNYGQTYYISAVVGNDDGTGSVDLTDGCLALAPGTPVTFYEIPTATLSGDASICFGDSTELTIDFTGEQPWEVIIDGQTITGINTPNISVTVGPNADQVYTITSATDANCDATISGMATVAVNEAPQVLNDIAECDFDTNTYTVTFDIIGGDAATYEVLPAGSGTLAGGTFTSNNFTSGQMYTFTIDDANGCGPVVISGATDCECETFIDGMASFTFDECDDQAITVFEPDSIFLDGNDAVQYYLHTDPNDPLGSVIDISNTPTFTFNPGAMSTGTTYYVSAIAGNDLGGGVVDVDDFCLYITSTPTPVLWNAPPSVALIATDAICEGDTATVTMTFSGVGPSYTIAYTVDGTLLQTTISSSPYSFTITPDQTTEIIMVSINDIGSGCSTASNESATVNVSQNVNAGTPTGDFEFCSDEQAIIDLNDNLFGGMPGGVWTDVVGNEIPNGMVDISTVTPGTNEYTYTLTTNPPCLNSSASLNVIINPTPVASAGPDWETDCNLSEVVLDGSNSTPGMDYEWIGGNVSDPNITNPTTSEPAVYTLTVTDPVSGCSDSDEAVVTQTITMPEPHFTVSPVDCFGDSNGIIVLDSIVGGVSPYLCSFNGSAFTDTKFFDGLSPGTYNIVIVDAAGCETTAELFVPEPEEVTVELVLDVEGDENSVIFGDSALLTAMVTPSWDSMDVVIWSPAEYIDCDTCQANYISPTQQTDFSIYVDENGCSDEDQMTVFVRKNREVYIPNAFSPNSDGTNDVFMIYAGGSVAKVRSFLVFNRWGETVWQYFNFEPNNPTYGWNGKHRGEFMNPAVFTWFAEVEFKDGSVELYEGDVTLVR